jgi:ADP-heptose:LPS heptosyltransferase
LLLTHPVAYNKSDYEAVSFLKLARSVTGTGVAFDKESPFLEIPRTHLLWADKITGSMKTPDIVTIAPGATAKDRIWPKDRYIQVIHWLLQNGYCVLLLGGKDALGVSKTITKDFEQDEVRNLCGKNSLPESAALIHKARAHLSSDTGILHVAYGLGTPTVSLFGPGLHDKWAPKGRRHVLLRAGLSCSPCIVDGEIPPCPHGAACIAKIEVAGVIQGLKKVLAL